MIVVNQWNHYAFGFFDFVRAVLRLSVHYGVNHVKWAINTDHPYSYMLKNHNRSWFGDVVIDDVYNQNDMLIIARRIDEFSNHPIVRIHSNIALGNTADDRPDVLEYGKIITELHFEYAHTVYQNVKAIINSLYYHLVHCRVGDCAFGLVRDSRLSLENLMPLFIRKIEPVLKETDKHIIFLSDCQQLKNVVNSWNLSNVTVSPSEAYHSQTLTKTRIPTQADAIHNFTDLWLIRNADGITSYTAFFHDSPSGFTHIPSKLYKIPYTTESVLT